MPKQTIHEKFEIDSNYNEKEDLAREIIAFRALFDKELAFIDGIEDQTFQLICMFAMIDRLAQEESNYSPDSKNTFCQFVLKHQKQCDYLEEVEPITLYYRIEDIIDEIVPLPGFPPEKEISLDDLGYLHAVKVNSVLCRGKSEKILTYIKQKNGAAHVARLAKDHQLISLLYRMRSKAVHEMSGLGENWSVINRDYKPKEPHYRNVNRSYVQDGNWVSDTVVELVIPNEFIRHILVDCIEGYLSNCIETNRFPFSNNHMTRKHLLSWYDK